MKITPLTLAIMILSALSANPINAQIADPIPERITYGELTLELEDWITMPQSSGGGFGRARISIFRALPDDRLFVNDLRGPLYRIDTGIPTEYLDIRDVQTDFIDQPGLGVGFHSFAFHPAFLENGKFYTVHTEPWNARTPDFKGPTAPVNSNGMQSVLTEWTADNPASDSFTGVYRELFRVYFPGNVHTMQEVAFNPNVDPDDPDYGILYVCIGEGGSYLRGYADNEHRLDSPMGTLFRIDPDGNNSANGNYGIPEDNPWFGDADESVIQEIYAFGFRNPHRIIFDTGGTNRIYVGDIGETQIEELNIIEAGRDYGFPEREGTFLLDPDNPQNNDEIFPLPANDETFGYTYPVAQFDHDEGIAIVAGPVYRGTAVPELEGLVLFGDIAAGRVFSVVEADLEFGSQAQITELRLSLDGVLGTLTSFVGNARADLRWGMDNEGEVYVMTKIDGKIRRVVGASSIEDSISDDPERWETVNSFSNGLGNWIVGNFADQTAWVPDPFGDATNGVLSLEGTGAAGYQVIPTTPDEASGSVFFSFALEDETSSARFDLGRLPVSSSQFSSIIGRVEGSGEFSVVANGSDLVLKDDLRPGIWYNVWILFLSSTESYYVYIQGDTATAPSLLMANLPLEKTMGAGFLRFGATLEGDGRAYFDEVSVDTSMANLSQPFAPRWALLSNFEKDGSLGIWTFADSVNGVQIPFAGEAVIGEELSGNNFLSFAPAIQDSVFSHAFAPLPKRVEVSRNLTLYSRFRVADTTRAVSQLFGFSNVAPESQVPEGIDSIETLGRIRNFTEMINGDSLELEFSDGGSFVPAIQLVDGFTEGEWLEYWIHARNGGEASGGQTFDVYLRPDGSDADPVLVFDDGDFNVGRETPLTLFSIIAPMIAENVGTIHYDDIFVIDGSVLDRPSGTGYGLLPGARGWKTLPWFGIVSDAEFPWILHPTHGWMYVNSENPLGDWFFDLTAGWLGVYPAFYPNVYSSSEGGWLYYLEGSSDPRWFYRYSDETWFSVP